MSPRLSQKTPSLLEVFSTVSCLDTVRRFGRVEGSLVAGSRLDGVVKRQEGVDDVPFLSSVLSDTSSSRSDRTREDVTVVVGTEYENPG